MSLEQSWVYFALLNIIYIVLSMLVLRDTTAGVDLRPSKLDGMCCRIDIVVSPVCVSILMLLLARVSDSRRATLWLRDSP